MQDYSVFTDQELMSMLIADDKLSFTEVFFRYHAPLYANAFNKLRDEDDAHDVVQEMFAKLWARRADLDPEGNLSGYLFKGIRNAIFDLIKHKGVVDSYEQSFKDFVGRSQEMPDHLIREKQFAAMIEKEIAALPPRMREVFELRRKEYLSNKEIARRMNITESTVADQMKKAMKLLKTRIGLTLMLSTSAHLSTAANLPDKNYTFFSATHPQSSFLNRNIYNRRLNTSYYDAEVPVTRVNH